MAKHQKAGKRCVFVMREKCAELAGAKKTLTFVIKNENQTDVMHLASNFVTHGSTICADEANAYDPLHAKFVTRRVNHQMEYRADDGTTNNLAESYFSRFRHMQYVGHPRPYVEFRRNENNDCVAGSVWGAPRVNQTQVQHRVIGFGADSTEFIAAHPDEAGKPDIEVITREDLVHLLYVKVTGTNLMRGDTYWVRPDKLAYAKTHADQDVWLILHYAGPQEKFVFIKPDNNKTYQAVSKIIRESRENYVEFSDHSPEVVDQSVFVKALKAKL